MDQGRAVKAVQEGMTALLHEAGRPELLQVHLSSPVYVHLKPYSERRCTHARRLHIAPRHGTRCVPGFAHYLWGQCSFCMLS